MIEKEKFNLLVAGVGNSLIQDDGVGVHIVRELAKYPLPDVLMVEVGTDFLGALHLFESAEVVLVIDAMEAGDLPGTIYLHEDSDILENERTMSLHELGVLASLRFVPTTKRPKVIIMGIEPHTIGFGLDLSPILQDKFDKFIIAAREIIDKICRGG